MIGYDPALLDMDVNDIHALELMEMVEKDSVIIEDYEEAHWRNSSNHNHYHNHHHHHHRNHIQLNANEQLCRLFVNAKDNAIVLVMSHLLFDGYSADSLFTFIDRYIDDCNNTSIYDSCDSDNRLYAVQDYRLIHTFINTSIMNSYVTDLQYWTKMLSQHKVGTRTIPMTLPFDSSILQHLNPYQIIQLLNDTLPFSVLFHIDTSILRCSDMNYYSNGCLLLIDKGSSVDAIEAAFRVNLSHASIPIYILINRFQLCNMVYMNHAVMRYEGYKHINVTFNMADDVREDYRGHYPLTVVHYGPQYCQMGVGDNFYYSS